MAIQPIVALDLGATKVACAIGLRHERSHGFELLGTGVVPYTLPPDTVLGDPAVVGRAVEQALQATGVAGDLTHAHVSLSHPGLHAEQVKVSVPLADEPITVRGRDIERLTAAAVNQVLGIDHDPLVVERLGCSGNGFSMVRDPRGLAATRLHGLFHVVTVPSSARRALIQAVESSGLEVIRIAYNLQAGFAAVMNDELARQRVLLVDVGGLTTDIGLFTESLLWDSRVVPWGGMTLARAIAVKWQVSLEQAARWSLEGNACPNADVRAFVEQQWQTLLPALSAMLERQPAPDVICLAGRGALLDGFAEWLERTVGLGSVLGRSPRTQRAGELARQVSLAPVMGLLESATRSVDAQLPSGLLNRVLGRTRSVLTEYF